MMKSVLVSVSLVLAVGTASAGTTYFWGSSAGTGDFESAGSWRTGGASGAAAADYPKYANGDTAKFDAVTAVVDVTAAGDIADITVQKGADVTLRLPATGVVTPHAFGFPWDNSALSVIRLVSGTLDLTGVGAKSNFNGNGSPSFFVSGAGTTLRNGKKWAPKQGTKGSPVVFGVTDGARLETVAFTPPTADTDEYARPQFYASGAGTALSKFTLNKATSRTDISFTDGVTVADSTLNAPNYGALTMFGASTLVTNTILRGNADYATFAVTGGVRWIGGWLSLAGDASNEPHVGNTLRVADATLEDFAFYPRTWSHGCDVTFGPNVTFRNLQAFDLSGYDSDYLLTGPNLSLDLDGQQLTVLGATGGVTTNRTVAIADGAEVVCSKILWNAKKQTVGTVFRVTGAGTRLEVRPMASAFGNGTAPVRIGNGDNTTAVATGNRLEVTDGATFAIVSRAGESYPAAYTDALAFFGAGCGNTNEMLVAAAGVFTNDFTFTYGDNYYQQGGNYNTVVVSNGTFYCGKKLRMGPRNTTHHNRLVVTDGGTASVNDLMLNENSSSGGNAVEVLDGILNVRNQIQSNETSAENGENTIRIGAEKGTVAVANNLYNNAYNSGKERDVRLAFSVASRKGREAEGACLRIGTTQTGSAAAAFAPYFHFKLLLDISAAYASARPDKAIDLISAYDCNQNRSSLGKLVDTVEPESLKGCTLSVVQENGCAILRLTPSGKAGFSMSVR